MSYMNRTILSESVSQVARLRLDDVYCAGAALIYIYILPFVLLIVLLYQNNINSGITESLNIVTRSIDLSL